jgi:hypothetical protein
MEGVPDFYDDLGATLRFAWEQLACGAADRRSPLNTPTLATRSTDGAPRARTVILRAVDAARRELTVYTDARSPKVGAIHSDPRVALHAYHHSQGFQLRMTGVARIHAGDDVARTAWERLRPENRLAYLGSAPGSQSPGPTAGGPDRFRDRMPDADELGEGLLRFAVLRLRVDALDWLYLHRAGNRRALFRWPGGTLQAGWLHP